MHACLVVRIDCHKCWQTSVTFCHGSISKDDVSADLALVTKNLETVPGSSAFIVLNKKTAVWCLQMLKRCLEQWCLTWKRSRPALTTLLSKESESRTNQ